MLCLFSKQIQIKDSQSLVIAELEIPSEDFTQEALSFFQLIKEKLVELRIEKNEARGYFRRTIENIKKIGFIPPLFLSAIRDIHGNYQTLIISQNLTAEEEQIISACFRPTIIGSNEIAQQTKNTALTAINREIVPFTNPFSGIYAEIYGLAMNYTCGNKYRSQEFTNKAKQALEKIIQAPPLPVTKRLQQITPDLLNKLFRPPQVNPQGIQSYFKKQAQAILRSRSEISDDKLPSKQQSY